MCSGATACKSSAVVQWMKLQWNLNCAISIWRAAFSPTRCAYTTTSISSKGVSATYSLGGLHHEQHFPNIPVLRKLLDKQGGSPDVIPLPCHLLRPTRHDIVWPLPYWQVLKVRSTRWNWNTDGLLALPQNIMSESGLLAKPAEKLQIFPLPCSSIHCDLRGTVFEG